MENKPITQFLKVMSIIFIIISVLSVIGGVFTLFTYAALPGLEELAEETAGIEITPMSYISIAVGTIASIINIVLAVMALKHKKLDLVYKIGIFTMIAGEVFSGVSASGISDYISLALGLVVPVLFLIAVFKQNQLDKEGK